MVAPSGSGATLFGGTPTTLTAPTYPGVLTAATLTAFDSGIGSNSWRVSGSGTANTIYGGRRTFTSVNLAGKFLTFSICISASGVASRITALSTATAAAGLMIALFDGSGNYRRWVLAGSTSTYSAGMQLRSAIDNGPFCVIDPSQTSTMQGDSGTLNLADIVAFELHQQLAGTDSSAFYCSRIYSIDSALGLSTTGGEIGNLGTFIDLTTYQSSQVQLYAFRRLSSSVFSSTIPITIASDRFEDLRKTIAFEPLANFSSTNKDVRLHIPKQRLNFNPPASGIVNLTDIQFNPVNTIAVASSLGAGATLNQNRTAIFNTESLTLVSGQVLNGGSRSNFPSLTLNGASVSNTEFSGATANPSIIIQSLGTNKRFTSSSLAGRTRINLAPGNYSALDYTVDANHVIELNGGPGTYILTGVKSTGTVYFDALQPGSHIVSIAGTGITGAANGVITAGSVTVQTPVASLNAINIADGARIYVGHQQVFSVASTAINSTANTLTLGNDSNGDAPDFAASSPYTLVRFDLATGATLPTSASSKLRDGGLYYATISGSAIQLFASAADIPATPIDFTSQGSGSFTLTSETELYNALVTGGLGLSLALTLSDAARGRFKAEHHYVDGDGKAHASKFVDILFAWDSVAGATIFDTCDADDPESVDTVHATIVDTTTLTFEGKVEDSAGNEVTSSTLPNSGDDAALLTSLSFVLEGRGKIQVNSAEADGIISWQELYLWSRYVFSTQAGIRIASATTAEANNYYNYQFLGLEFEETTGTQLKIVGGVGRSSDGSDFISSATIGSIVANAASRGTGAIIEGGGGSGGATAAEVWAHSTRSLTDKAGFSLSTAGIQAIWDALTSALTTVGSIGKLFVDNLNATVGSRSTYAGGDTAGTTTLLGRLTSGRATNLDNLDATVSSRLANSSYTTPPTVGAIATAVESQLVDDFVELAFDVAAVQSAVNAIPTNPLLAGSYTAPNNAGITAIQTAVAAIPTNPLLAGSYTAPDNAGIAAIKAKTDNLPSDPADQSLLSEAIAALPAPLNSTQTQAAVANALNAYDAATASDVQITVTPTAVTVNGGFGTDDRDALEAARKAAEATAKGRFRNDFTASTATQYDADGNSYQVFDLLDADELPASSPATATERRPKP